MDYVCYKCGYTTKNKYNFKRHVNRQTPCEFTHTLHLKNETHTPNVLIDTGTIKNKFSKCSTNVAQNSQNVAQKFSKCSTNVAQKKTTQQTKTYKCKYCNIEFKQHSSRYRHEKKYCKTKNTFNDNGNDNEININNVLNETNIITDFYRREQEWNNERKELLGHINKLIDKTGNTTINDYSNNMQNNFNNIPTVKKLRDFGDENMEHITHEFCKELLKEPYSGPNKLVRAIHFNPDYVENNNVQATNRKSNITKVVKGGEWEYINKNTLLNREFIKTNKILDDCFDKEKDNMEKGLRELYERFQISRNELHQYNNTLCNIFVEILNGTNKTKLLKKAQYKLINI